MSSTRKWGIWGALFGLAFPIMAMGIRAAQHGWAEAVALATQDPLLWIIASAPLFLGVFAMLGGMQNDKVRDFSANLERLVEERTQELRARNQAMRVVLDNVNQGLATIHPDGTLDPERSALFENWFSTEEPSADFSQVLAANDNTTREMLQLGWEGVVDGFLPREMALEQIPSRLEDNGKQFEVSYKALGQDENNFEGALVMVSDITERIARRKKEAQQREVLVIFQAIMEDRNGFIGFFNETERLIEQLCGTEALEEGICKRHLHTVKGNTAIHGILSLSEVAHQLEDVLAEEARPLSGDEQERLRSAWADFSEKVRSVAPPEEERVVEVDYEDLDDIVGAVRSGSHPTDVEAKILALRFEPTRVRFQRMKKQACVLAEKLGRARPEFLIEDRGLRLPAKRWETLWGSLIHVVRNAVDHGLETESERREAGKPAAGTLRFSSMQEGADVILEIADDGRGVDWEKVAEKAKSANMPHEAHEDLVAALFSDGISTRSETTETSGRGVGTSAVLQVVEEMGGKLTLISEPNQGTTLRFEIPREDPNLAPHSLRAGIRPSLVPQKQREPAGLRRSS